MATVQSLYERACRTREHYYNSTLASGRFTPFIYPWDTLPVLYMFCGIAFRQRVPKGFRKLFSWSTVLATIVHGAYIINQRRMLGMASGYGTGLITCWGCIMAVVLSLIHNCSTDFARLEWRPKSAYGASKPLTQPDFSTSPNTKELRRRKANGPTKPTEKNFGDHSSESEYRLVWQPMPSSSFTHLLDWTLDLMTTFRGPNWNFRVATMIPIAVPPLPSKRAIPSPAIKVNPTLGDSIPYHTSGSPGFRYKSLRNTIITYLQIDLAKTIVITDPYFLGLVTLDSPSPWTINQTISDATGLPLGFVVRFNRLFMSLYCIVIALTFIFSLSPTCFYTIFPLFIDLRKITYAPLEDSSMYASTFMSPFSAIPDKGLAGMWGQTWHQMFRYGITEPSRAILRLFNIKSRSRTARIIQLLVAFSLTGLIHMLASSTTFSIMPAKPWDAFLFFFSQAIAIIFQTWVADLITKTWKLSPPKLLRQSTNVVFVLVWLYFSGPLLANDFARCGIWYFEPVPVSLIRGIRDGKWWCLGGGKWFQLWTGNSVRSSIFETGLAFL